MGHVLLGAPPLARFHLHQRLWRALGVRGHRVTVLARERGDAAFWSAQGMDTRWLSPGAPVIHHLPLEEPALRDAILEHRDPLPRARARIRAARRLGRWVGPLLGLLEREAPDVLLIHGARTGFHRLLAHLASEQGCHVLHCGDGLLPGTMQWDGDGLDGDASWSRRKAADYRDCRRDPEFLAAALSSWIAGSLPPPLSRVTVRTPAIAPRLRAAAGRLARGCPRAAWQALGGWSAARGSEPELPVVPRRSPAPPFVAVLLQHPHDERLLLDASAGTSMAGLVRAVASAAAPEGLEVVAVMPRAPLPALLHDTLATARVRPWPEKAAAQVLATALAVVTVNHPLGAGALLAGTPALHAGRTPWGIPGVAQRTSAETLAEDLPRALTADASTLRQRFLTRVLAVDHVWCSPDHPDHNGLNGMVSALEARLHDRGHLLSGLSYRAGPVWPLEPV